MRNVAYLLGMLLLGFGISSLCPAQNESRPHMDLVRGLRKDHMADLALQYLDSLKAANLDPETQAILDLEYARTWLDLAAEETEEGKRTALISDAKRKLEAFIKSKHALSLQATVDLAKLYSVQGRTLIRKARRHEDVKDQEPEMKAARVPLKAAADLYTSTAAQIEDKIKQLEKQKGSGVDKTLRDMVDVRLNARLDLGITAYYMGETYVGQETKDIKEQGEQYKSAKGIFEAIRYEDEKLPIRWVAMAWSSQADLKAGDAGSSERTMTDLFAKKNVPAATAGIRVARYFQILNNFENAKDYAKLEKDTEAWLKDYPSQRDSTEGLGCRYRLAIAERSLAVSGFIRDKNGKLLSITNAARIKLDRAQRLFKVLADSDNEYSERSTRNRSIILVAVADADGHGDVPPIASLTTFEQAYLMAQVQIARFSQFKQGGGKSKPSPEDVKKEENKRFGNAIQFIEHGLKLANPVKDGLREIFAAKWTLVLCYYEMHMYPQAAILADHLVREYPKMTNAPRAGSVAVAMYNQAQIELKKLKEKAPEAKDEAQRKEMERRWDEGVKADVDHTRRSAGYMIKMWPADALSDESRHILARDAFLGNRFNEALKYYVGIRSGYGGLQNARLELASVMFVLVYPKGEEKDVARFKQIVNDRLKQYASEWKETISLMEAVPAPDEEAPAGDVVAYLENRAQLARLFQLADQQDKAMHIGEVTVKEVDKFDKLKPEQKLAYHQISENLVLNGLRAQASHEFKAGNHARVAELLNARVADIEKDFDKGDEPEQPTQAFQRLRRTQREVVVLALQSCVQDSKIDRAGELLDILGKSGGSAEESLNMLQTLVSNIRSQVEDLEAAVKAASLDPQKKEEAVAKAKEAASLKEGFAKLLEKLLARDEKKVPPRMKLFLASGLASVGAYDKAIEELEKFRKLALPDGVKEEDWPRMKQQAQFILARTYRQKKDYTKALVVFKEMIGEVALKGSTPKDKQGWAFASLQVRKEKASMLEEMAHSAEAAEKLKRWGEAVQEWLAIGRTFAPRLEALRQTLKPEDEARKILFTIVKAPRDESDDNSFCLLGIAWLGHQYGTSFGKEREKAAAEAQSTAAKRERYFDLFFDQKRCSVKAFKDLGTKATGGDAQKLQEKFAGFAKDFVELQSPTKNPDISQTLKDRIKQLVDETDELKREYITLIGK